MTVQCPCSLLALSRQPPSLLFYKYSHKMQNTASSEKQCRNTILQIHTSTNTRTMYSTIRTVQQIHYGHQHICSGKASDLAEALQLSFGNKFPGLLYNPFISLRSFNMPFSWSLVNKNLSFVKRQSRQSFVGLKLLPRARFSENVNHNHGYNGCH